MMMILLHEEVFCLTVKDGLTQTTVFIIFIITTHSMYVENVVIIGCNSMFYSIEIQNIETVARKYFHD